jgi:hypothetical protein
MEYGTLCVCIVVFCQDCLFLRVGAAHSRAIAVAAFNNLPAPNALDPGKLVGMLQIRARSYSPA